MFAFDAGKILTSHIGNCFLNKEQTFQMFVQRSITKVLLMNVAIISYFCLEVWHTRKINYKSKDVQFYHFFVCVANQVSYLTNLMNNFRLFF